MISQWYWYHFTLCYIKCNDKIINQVLIIIAKCKIMLNTNYFCNNKIVQILQILIDNNVSNKVLILIVNYEICKVLIIIIVICGTINVINFFISSFSISDNVKFIFKRNYYVFLQFL